MASRRVPLRVPTLTVIVPAFNEEAYLPATLAAVHDAAVGLPCEVIVVDNESTDRTREIALALGARVVSESVHNIGKVRNAGARAALSDVLVFVDADTSIPLALLGKVPRSSAAAALSTRSAAMTKRSSWARILSSTGG